VELRRCEACKRYLYRDEHRVCRQCRGYIKGFVGFVSDLVLREMCVRNDGVTIGATPSPAVQPASGGLVRTLNRTAGRTLNT
jgi:hypothetical protein